VVHTGGTPRLVRMTPKAGAALTENLTRALGVDFERAEALKRGAGVAVADPHTAQAADIIASELTPLVQEIQGSLDYFLAQTDDVELRRVLLTGAGAKMAGLRNRLATELRVPVEMASPLEYLRIGRTGLSDEQLTNAAAVMAAPVGLAMAPLATPATKLVSLFPAEHRKADTDRSLKVAAGAGVAAFAMLLGGLWVVRQAEVTSTRSDVRGATTRADQLQRQVTALAPFELAERTVLARQAEAQAVLATDVDVVDILDRFTAALPGDVAATNITVSTASPGGAAGQAAATAGGTITIAGVATDINGASHWITAMRQLDIFTGVWVPSDSRGGTGTAGATFAGNLDLTPKARSNRAEQFKADLP
ncbi:MAG: pilus assembly protein PilM, partial [Acidimicrobiales bacterium]